MDANNNSKAGKTMKNELSANQVAGLKAVGTSGLRVEHVNGAGLRFGTMGSLASFGLVKLVELGNRERRYELTDAGKAALAALNR